MQLFKLIPCEKDKGETYLSSLGIAIKYNLMRRGGKKPSSHRAVSAINSYLKRNKIDFEDIYFKNGENVLVKSYPSYIYEPAMKEFFERNYGITDLENVADKGPFIV